MISVLKEENAKLLMENNILRTDIGYWKSRHQQAVEREEVFKKELQDKKARIKYLTRQLYEKKVVYVIDPTRSARVIEEHLGHVIGGILLVDRYSAYKSYARKHAGIILAFCWAHARRDFRDAGLKYALLREWAGSWEERINALFHLNKLRVQYAQGSSAFCREDTRLREALAEMEELWREERKQDHLHHHQRSVLKSLATHWEGLTVFVDHPEIPMDNNGSERTLRNPVVGRKNYYPQPYRHFPNCL